MQVTIVSCCSDSLSFAESKRDQAEVKKNVKYSKNSANETMTVTKAKPVCITGKPNSEEKRSMPFKDMIRRRPTLKELQEKKYPFSDSDWPGMLDDLFKRRSFNFQSQTGLNRWEGLRTPNTAVTIRW